MAWIRPLSGLAHLKAISIIGHLGCKDVQAYAQNMTPIRFYKIFSDKKNYPCLTKEFFLK
jgi:hypothetical protein